MTAMSDSELATVSVAKVATVLESKVVMITASGD